MTVAGSLSSSNFTSARRHRRLPSSDLKQVNNDGKRRAILITNVLSGEEQGEHFQLAAVQICTENYARGTGGTEENLHSSHVFSRSLVVDSTPS